MHKEKNIKDILIDELHDMYSSENQIVAALPTMVTAAESTELRDAFKNHLKETKEQVTRLKKVFKLMGLTPKKKFCSATKGLIQECKDVLKEFKKKSPVRDAALISKAQRIEHYEISAYGTVRTWAKELSMSEVVDLLDKTLKEESNADKSLSKIAEGGLFASGINRLALMGNPEDAGSEEEKGENKTKKMTKKAKKATKKATKGVVTTAKKSMKKVASKSKIFIRKKTAHKTAQKKKATASHR